MAPLALEMHWTERELVEDNSAIFIEAMAKVAERRERNRNQQHG